MSQENVEIVRGHIEAFRQDVPRAHRRRPLSFLDPCVVLDRSRVGGIDTEAAYGHEAVAQAIARYVGAFEEYVYEVERLTDLGSGAILAVVTETGRGKSSGVPVRRSFATLYTVIDGKIARITLFPSEEQALEAAGLRGCLRPASRLRRLATVPWPTVICLSRFSCVDQVITALMWPEQAL
jgi:ketosteroid isomerase-like protein